MKVLTIIIPEGGDGLQTPQIITNYALENKEMEKAFDALDFELHDVTYNELDKLCTQLRCTVEEQNDIIDHHQERIEDLSRRRIV